MNNERTPFDIEWAKRGGICAIDDEDIGKTTLYIFTQRGFIALNRRGRDFFWEMPIHGDLYKQAIDSDMRMATCAECEVAGLEYIEPPLKRVTELESAIRAFIDENKHLADGDNCTLAGLKQVIGGDDD